MYWNHVKKLSLELSTAIFYFYTQDKCSPNDTYICKNAGVCKITKTGAASCTCNKEYAGESCEVGKYIFNPNAICYILSFFCPLWAIAS